MFLKFHIWDFALPEATDSAIDREREEGNEGGNQTRPRQRIPTVEATKTKYRSLARGGELPEF